MKTTTIARVITHACPRCQGDLFMDEEDGDAGYYCLQCGRRADAVAIVAQALTPAAVPTRTQPTTVQARAA
jgi:hypothetical protein